MVILVASSSASSLRQIFLHNSHRVQCPGLHTVRFKRLVCTSSLIRGNSSSGGTSSGSKLILLGNNNNNSSSSGNEKFYQPFRPPTTFDTGISIDEQLEVVRERRGQWYEYGKHIPALMRSGYTPATLEEATGMSGVEQNQIVVACQVRDTLMSGGMSDEALAYFDTGSAVLYELRTLSAQQRMIAAEYVMQRDMEAKTARDVARALKDFERRKREFGWDFFSKDPGDTLAFWWYRQSKEFKSEGEKQDALKKALEFATSSSAQNLLKSYIGDQTLDKGEEVEEKTATELTKVVRLILGETAGLVMLPLAEPDVKSVREAPTCSALGEGNFRIHRSPSAWKAWVPLPGWKPVLDATAPVTVLFPNRKALGLDVDRNQNDEELLVVIDKGKVDTSAANTKQEIAALVYLVADSSSEELLLMTGKQISGGDAEVLGQVVLALSPPDTESEVDEVDMD